MADLAKHLAAADPGPRGLSVTGDQWQAITDTITLKGLEPALQELTLTEEVAEFVRSETASLLLSKEATVVSEVLSGSRILKLSRLLPHLPQDERLKFVTTNYDRLIEFAAEISGFKVDTKAFGLYHATFSANAAPYAYCDVIDVSKTSIRRVERRLIALYKPHGSLDWMLAKGVPIRSGFTLGPNHCLIITPGRDKYRAGYDQPFDMQRELANRAIDEAQRFLILGYGFNDDHLEKHLTSRIRQGTPTVILTHTLSANTRGFLTGLPNFMALEADAKDGNSTKVYFRDATHSVKEPLWDVDGFVRGVMGT